MSEQPYELPALLPANFDIRAMFARSAEMAEHDRYLPRPKLVWYNQQDLIGVPFVFRSEKMSKTGKFGPQYQAWVSVVNLTDGSLQDPIIVSFSHKLIMEQLSLASGRDLVGSRIFTIAPSEAKRADGTPMLAIANYVYGVDRPPEEEAIFDEPLSDFVRQNGASQKPSPAERKAVRESQEILAQGPVSRGPGRPKGMSAKTPTDAQLREKEASLAAVQPGMDAREAVSALVKFPWESND